MKVRDLKVGEIYKLKNKQKVMTLIFTENIKLHPKVKDVKDIREEMKKLPKSLNYLHVGYGGNRCNQRAPIMYLGHTKENWSLSGIDWSPIRKRHWCMYQGQRMLLDAWAVQHFEKYIGE
jgi:hypothetical protein